MGLSSSIGSLIGFSISGLLVHAIGSQGVLGLLSIPAILVLSVGLLLKEALSPSCSLKQVYDKFLEAIITMWETWKLPPVWRPCFYMYLSLALSLNIQEGMFIGTLTHPKVFLFLRYVISSSQLSRQY